MRKRLSTLDRGVTPENARLTSFGVDDMLDLYVIIIWMADFLEAVVLLFPTEAGGRHHPIAPREGSYRPMIGSIRARFIEGPPTIAPGQGGRVVVELEDPVDPVELTAGIELQIVEQERVVGILTVTRFCRKALAV